MKYLVSHLLTLNLYLTLKKRQPGDEKNILFWRSLIEVFTFFK